MSTLRPLDAPARLALHEKGIMVLKDLSVYTILGVIIVVFSVPLWLLVIPVLASVSTIIRHARHR